MNIRQTLSAAGIRPRKSWGQNFLVHGDSAEKIVRWSNVSPKSLVLEIGPGLGALTNALGKHGCRVVAIERDKKLVELLSREPEERSWLRLLHNDVLQEDLQKISQEEAQFFTVVSNLPYALSTPIIEHLLQAKAVIQEAVLLLQEEVVDRMGAEVGTSDYGRLSIGIQADWEIERGPRISRGSFYPVPEVESCLVRLTPRKLSLVPNAMRDKFFELVNVLFQQRRKTLRRGLRKITPDPQEVKQILEQANIDDQRRPQTLSIEELLRLTEKIPKKGS